MNQTPELQRAALRLRLREQRRQLGPRQRMLAAQGLRQTLAALPALARADRVAGYWACQGEIPLNLVLADIEARKQSYWLPRLAPGRKLQFARWRGGDTVVANRYGIPEPAASAPTIDVLKLDIVLLPLVAFDACGNRLGSGGGYYDRTLAACKVLPQADRPLLVGVAHHFQQLGRLDAQPWDVPLDFVATERQLIDCTTQRSAK